MPKRKIAITVEEGLVRQLDELITQHHFESRSEAFESAINDTLTRLQRTRLARECAKLDADEERKMAEEGLSADVKQWPEY
jgi:metal-responsive CopG/Arc/MetJ family transcriptional regulator